MFFFYGYVTFLNDFEKNILSIFQVDHLMLFPPPTCIFCFTVNNTRKKQQLLLYHKVQQQQTQHLL